MNRFFFFFVSTLVGRTYFCLRSIPSSPLTVPNYSITTIPRVSLAMLQAGKSYAVLPGGYVLAQPLELDPTGAIAPLLSYSEMFKIGSKASFVIAARPCCSLLLLHKN